MAAASFEHAGAARAALRAIVSDPAHGPGSLDDPQLMGNLLQDLLPDAPREAGILAAAASRRVAQALRSHSEQGLDPATAIRLAAASLAESTAFTPQACEWAAGELAVALGLAAAADMPPPGATALADAEPRTGSPAPLTDPSRPAGSAHLVAAGEPTRAVGRQAHGLRRADRRSRAALVIAGSAVVIAAAAAGYALARPARGTVAAQGSRAPGRTHQAGGARSSRPAVSPAARTASQAAPSASPSAPPPASQQPPATPAAGVPVPDNVWIAQLDSVSQSASSASVDATLAKIRLDVPQAQILDSTQYASLRPGYWVIYYQGSFGNGVQALAFCAAHGRPTSHQCIGRYLSQSAADFGDQCYPPASSPAGTCYHAAVTGSERSIRLHISLCSSLTHGLEHSIVFVVSAGRQSGGYPPPAGGAIPMLVPLAADQLAGQPVRPAIGSAAQALYSDKAWRPVTVLAWARFRASWAVLVRWADGSQDWRAYDSRSLRPAGQK